MREYLKKWKWLVVILAISTQYLVAQEVPGKPLTLAGQGVDLWTQNLSDQVFFQNKQEVEDHLRMGLNQLINLGHFEASVDSLAERDDDFLALLHAGDKYNGVSIVVPDSLILSLTPNTYKEVTKYPLSPDDWSVIQNEIVADLSERGYPFAQVGLGGITIEDTDVTATLDLRLGVQYKYDDIQLAGKSGLSTKYLSRYLGWNAGKIYSHQNFALVKSRIDDLPYVKLTTDPRVVFTYDQASLKLNLEKQRANKFDFILGVLPGNDFQDRPVIFSVLLNTAMYNLLGAGERIAVDFANTKPEAQELKIDLDYPFILSMPFGVAGGFELFRNQETNLDIRYKVGLFYQSTNRLRLSSYYQRISSSLLSVDTTYLINNMKLPPNLDHSFDKVGIELLYSQLDNALSPRQGIRLFLGISAGIKKIDQTNEYISLNSQELPVESYYEELGERTEQYEINVKIEKYWAFWRRFSFLWAIQGKAFFGPDKFLENELYRLGGNRLLRGFDEEFFRANLYTVNTMELRFFLDRNSYFAAFYDFGYLQKQTNDVDLEDNIQGFGLGMTFQTPVGIFNLSYALGQSRQVPLDVNAGKIHFGYISLF